MTNTLRLLVALGFLAQVMIVAANWYELTTMIHGDSGGAGAGNIALFVSPSILGFGGAAAAAWLHRRGSGWAWVVAVVPLVLLSVALCLAGFLWLNPITHQP